MIKKGLLTLMLVAFGIFAAGIAQAALVDGLASSSGPAAVTNLYVNPGGLGDALIYGYYNVKGGNLNFLRVVNTSSNMGVGAKIRFREGKNSNEVLDFFICLSARDQWSAWIYDGGTGLPAVLAYWDNDTPTYPDPQRDDDPTNNLTATTFATELFHDSSSGAASSVTKDDTKEGYFEIIANMAWDDTPGNTKKVKTPKYCKYMVINAGYDDSGNPIGITPKDEEGKDNVPNSLMGNLYIFDIAAGAGTYAYNATALANFANAPFRGSIRSYSPPLLENATEGLDAVNFVLTKAVEYATYDLQFNGATTIINTFPTKRLSIESLHNTGNGPFRDDADINKGLDGKPDGTILNRCETINIKIWDDAENSPTTSDDVSPRPTEEQFQKCNEVSLVKIGSGNPVLTTGLLDITVPNAGFDLGWISEDFQAAGRSTTINGVTTNGLPVISYELQDLADGYFTHMLPLRYETSVQ